MKNIKDYFMKSGLRGLFASTSGQRGMGHAAHPRRRKIIIGIAIVILVFLVLAIIAPFVIDLNRYKGPILARLRPALNRNVDFKSINLTVLTGIGAEIEGLTIPENPQFASDNFVYVESAKARLQLLPLLRGEVRIAKISLNSPVVNIRRNPQGTFNFADIVGKKEEKPKESKVPAILASLGISELAIRDATITYVDKKVTAKQGEPPRPGKSISVSNFDVVIENISLTEKIAIAARGALFSGTERNFSLTGEVGPVGLDLEIGKMPVDLALTIDSLPMKGLTEGLGLPFSALSGEMNGDLSASGNLNQKLEAATKITVKDLVMQKRAGPAPVRKAGAIAGELSGKLAYNAPAQEITVNSGTLTINNSTFSILGKAQNILSTPAWNFVVRSVSLNPSSLVALSPIFGVTVPEGLTLKGPGRMEFSTVGTKEDIAIQAGIDLSPTDVSLAQKFHKPAGLAFTLGSEANMQQGVLNIRSLNLALYNLMLSGTGTVNMKDKVSNIDLQFTSKPASLKGWDALVPMLKNYRLGGSLAVNAGITGTTKDPSVKFQATSEQLGFTLPPDKTKGKDAKETNAVLRGLNLNVDGKIVEKKFASTGTLGIKSGNFSNIALSNVSTSFRYSPQRIDVPTFSLGVFGGTVSGSASYLPLQKDWALNPVFKGLNAGQAMNTLTSFKDIFAGTLSGDMQIRGNTALKGIDSLSTKGTIAIAKGKINNLDLVRSVIDGFTGIQGLSGLITTEQGAVQRNQQTAFDSMTASFGMYKKVLEVRPLKLNNIHTGKETNTIATLEGTVDLVSRKLGFGGNVALSPEYSSRLSKRTPALNALMNNQKRVIVPIRITGTTNRPLVTLQVKDINQALAEYYARKGIEKGLERLRKRLNVPDENKESNGDKTQDAVDDLLRGIFKK